MRKYSKGMGWHNDSERHRLARLGIKTAYAKETVSEKFKSFLKRQGEGVDIARKKHPLMSNATETSIYSSVVNFPYGTIAGMPLGAYMQKKKIDREKAIKEFEKKYKGSSGKGWWGEGGRHKISRLGVNVGSKVKKEKTKFPHIFANPVKAIGLGFGLTKGAEELESLRGNKDKLKEYFKKHGWQIRNMPNSLNQEVEVWKGDNYMMFVPSSATTWKAHFINLPDNLEFVRIKKILRKPRKLSKIKNITEVSEKYLSKKDKAILAKHREDRKKKSISNKKKVSYSKNDFERDSDGGLYPDTFGFITTDIGDINDTCYNSNTVKGNKLVDDKGKVVEDINNDRLVNKIIFKVM